MTLAKMAVPLSTVGDIYTPESALSMLNGKTWEQACADGSCFKTLRKDLSFFPGRGWYYQESWSLLKDNVEIAQQVLAYQYPQDPQSGLIYLPSASGGDNTAVTVGQAAVYLLGLAEMAQNGDPNRTGWENFVGNLPNENWSQTNNADGSVTISNPNGHTLTFNDAGTSASESTSDPNRTGWADFVGNLPNENWSQTNNADGSVTICNPGGQCLTFTAPDSVLAVSNSLDQPNRTGWADFVGNLPNENWSQTNNADGSVTICNPGNQCATFWPITTGNDSGGALPTNTPGPGSGALPTNTPGIVPTATSGSNLPTPAPTYVPPADTPIPSTPVPPNPVPTVKVKNNDQKCMLNTNSGEYSWQNINKPENNTWKNESDESKCP